MVLVPLLLISQAAGNPLPRKPMLGIQFEPGTLKVRATIPGGSAEGALQPGDELVGAGEVTLTSSADLGPVVAKMRTSEILRLKIKRSGETLTKDLTLKERPRETSPDYDVIYSHVMSNGHRIRTILTKPKKEGKFPVFMMMQGLGAFSMDYPLSGSGPYDVFLRNFAKQDFVTVRVEKPGMGDAEGGPYTETDFKTEGDVYLQALRSVKKESFIDPDKVFVFGHSMGGCFGPYVLSQEKVRGFITASTVYKTWVEYWLENLRRQLILAGWTPERVHDHLRAQAVIQPLIFAENWTPEKVKEAFPQYKSVVDAEYSVPGKWQGRTLHFWQQLAQLNYAELWKKTDTDILSLWGQFDFISTEEDNQMIAKFKGQGAEYRRIDNANHGFGTVSSYEDAYAKLSASVPPNLEAVKAIDSWIKARL